MTILVNHPDEVQVDLNQTPEDNTEVTPEQVEQEAAEAATPIPEKFQGKSAEDIIDMYTNLESQYGRLTNELGDYRTMTDRFLSLEEKRVADLGQHEEESFEIDPTELLANPEKVLDEYYQRRLGDDPNVKGLEERLNRIEGQVSQSTLNDKHADAAEIAGSPEFVNWVQGNGYRHRIAQEAVQNKDTEALDYLLTEFKSSQVEQPAQEQAPQQSEAQAARAVSTESSSTGSAVDTGKRFSRRKLVQLKVENPEEYSSRSQEILLAYAQGRVDD